MICFIFWGLHESLTKDNQVLKSFESVSVRKSTCVQSLRPLKGLAIFCSGPGHREQWSDSLSREVKGEELKRETLVVAFPSGLMQPFPPHS